MPYSPMLCCYLRWNIEVSYYEQKNFWALCSYIIRSQKGIEMPLSCRLIIIPRQKERPKHKPVIQTKQRIHHTISNQFSASLVKYTAHRLNLQCDF